MMIKKVASIVREHFDALADQYDTKSSARTKYLSTINNLTIKELAEQKLKHMKVLDVGCGTGSRAQNIFSTLPMASIFGMDISLKMIEIASTNKLKCLAQSDMCNMPFQTESFEVVTCLFNAIGYLETHRKRTGVFNEFHRVLKPGGLLFIDFMNRWHLGEGVNFRRSIFTALGIYIKSFFPDLENCGNQFFDLPLNGRHLKGFVHGFSRWEIQKLLTKSGFDVVSIFVVGYDTGQIKEHNWQGQYFIVAKKSNRLF